jgi:hypothetical protein
MRVGGAVPYDVCMHVTWENITCVTGVHRLNIQEWLKRFMHVEEMCRHENRVARLAVLYFDTFARFLAGGSA